MNCNVVECRIPPTSTLRWSWLTKPMLPSVMIQGLTGYATQCISTENFVVSLQLVRNTGVSEEKDTCTTKHVLQEEQPGRGTKLSLSAATVNLLGSFEPLLSPSFVFNVVTLLVWQVMLLTLQSNWVCVEQTLILDNLIHEYYSIKGSYFGICNLTVEVLGSCGWSLKF